jgi:type IV pilus assembly protein PilC
MSSLMASGVTLVRALDIVSDEEGQPQYMKEIIRFLMSEVKKGISLSEAMESCGCFPQLMLGMIRSGEGNGNIDVVMHRLAIQYEKEHKTNQQVKSAMTYPVVLLVLCVAIVGVIVAVVMPQFESLFAEMESLPVITEVLLGVSAFLKQSWYLVAIAVFLLVVVFRILGRVRSVRRKIDYCKVHIPVIGKLNKIIYTSRFSRTLSSLYSSGMPIAYAIRTAGETVGNIYVEEQFEEVATQVRSGVPLSTALKDVDGLIKKLSSTIFVGEESGRLDAMLNSIADTMEEEASQATKRLVTILEPLMIIVMALLIGFVVAAVMLPIIQSYGAIEGASY